MSFFGLDSNSAIEEEKRRFLAGEAKADEDIAVYNWGEQDYDGLGDVLQEGGDDLNDETFGGSGPVGKDFDFTTHTLPGLERRSRQTSAVTTSSEHAREQPSQLQSQSHSAAQSSKSSTQAHPVPTSRESIWDDKSPFSVLRTSSSFGRKAGSALGHQASSSLSSTRPLATNIVRNQTQSPAVPQQSQTPVTHAAQAQITTDGAVDYSAPGTRTLAEIEAEMRAQTQRARELKMQEQLLLQQQQQQQQQQMMKPPRMRSQSPLVHQGMPTHSPQAGYQASQPVLDTRRQQILLQEVENLRLQEQQRGYHKDAAYVLQEGRNRTHTPVDPIEFMLQKTAERERGLPRGRLPAQQFQQQRFDELDFQEQERRARMGTVPAHADDLQANLRRQIVADQQRHAQLAAAGLLEQRRESPMDQLHHIRTRNDVPSGILGANPAEIAHMQMQQRMLAQLAQQEFVQGMNGANGQNVSQRPTAIDDVQREHLRNEAMRKIMEAERLEAKRRRKAHKIAHMSRYNDLMTQSDKDFITRIQVSQLVTSDPYTEDFYAQVYGSLMRSRMGIDISGERVLKFGSGEGVGLGLNQRGGNRRPNAMQRMEAQVERIVNNARQREKEKGLHAIHSLQGALGKTAGRSYKAAPRQLLQVDTNGASDTSVPHTHGHISKDDSKENAAGAAKEAAKRGREALGVQADVTGQARKDPLTRRECLIILESLYDSQLKVEQLRRQQPPPEDEARLAEWEAIYRAETNHLWDNLRVMVPLETSNPHPFISLLMPAKGKKLLPRLARHLNTQQLLQAICLLVACFSQLDVVKNAAILDSQEDTAERREVDRQTQLFLSTVLQSILPVIAKFNLGVVVGMLGLLMEHCDMGPVIHSRPGQALLTAFLSRAEVIKSETMAGSSEPSETASEEDLQAWQSVVLHLYHVFGPYVFSLFPSSRIPTLRTPAGVPTMEADLLDQPVWKFLATFALHADNEQQQILVSTLREKILDNVLAVNKGFVTDESEQNLKITNVNIFLHALGLDSSQINV